MLHPARAKVRTGQSTQELPFCGDSTVRHQVNFQEPRPFFIPFGKGADGNEAFQQTSRFSRTHTMWRLDADWAQAAIDAGGTDFQEQVFGVFGKLDFLATLQHSNGFG